MLPAQPTRLIGREEEVAAAAKLLLQDDKLGEEAFARAWAEGKAMAVQDAIALALELHAPSVSQRIDPLTQREREVAGLVARGMTNRQIASALWISEGTANLHVKHILGKLGFASRSQIAVWVVQAEVSP